MRPVASLAVQPALEPQAVESLVDAPRRTPEPGDRQGADAERTAARDRVTISAAAREKSIATGKELDAAELAEVARLRVTDQRVRTHERAHQTAGGNAAGSATFRYVTGPDGKTYAVAGEVPIRFEAGRTPDETIAAAQRMRSAALAPADPSAQDLAVAAEAARLEQDARAQKAREASTVQRPASAARAAEAYMRFGMGSAQAAAAGGGGASGAASGALLAIRA